MSVIVVLPPYRGSRKEHKMKIHKQPHNNRDYAKIFLLSFSPDFMATTQLIQMEFLCENCLKMKSIPSLPRILNIVIVLVPS